MRALNPEIIEHLRKEYPRGCRVELVRMEDVMAPPAGTIGIVIAVDDVGTVHVHWNNGSKLGIAYGKDICRRIDND